MPLPNIVFEGLENCEEGLIVAHLITIGGFKIAETFYFNDMNLKFTRFLSSGLAIHHTFDFSCVQSLVG